MRRFFFILLAGLVTVAAFGATAFAKDSSSKKPAATQAPAQPVQDEKIASTDLGFVPDGLAKDVLNLMNGISKPIDDSTNVTFQAGKSFRFGISF